MDRRLLFPLLVLSIVLCARAQANPVAAGDSSLSATADAALQNDHGKLYLATRSRSYRLAQYAYGGRVGTVVVDGEVSRRLRVSDDIGAESQPSCKIALAIHPIESGGRFGAVTASRELPGDEIRLDSPAGVAVIAYGCCAENSSETELSLENLKTLYVSSGGLKLSTYTILGKPARGRVIALYLAMTPSDDAVLGPDPSAIGLITVAGEGDVLQRIQIHLHAGKPREAALDWSFEHGWLSAAGALEEHTVIDPAKPSKSVFEWRIDDNKMIAIPLINDRLDVATAKLPAGVTLEPLPSSSASTRK